MPYTPLSFCASKVDVKLLKPVLEISEEPRHWLTFANEHVRVFRVATRLQVASKTKPLERRMLRATRR